MVRIKDIAERANVSSATVSRILRNDPLLSVREETRAEVLEIAQNLGYEPKTRRVINHRKIGVVQWISRFEEETDPYYGELRKTLEAQLEQRGYRVNRYYKEDLHHFPDGFDVSGLICVGKFSQEQAQMFKDTVRNVVFIDSNPDSEKYSSVVFDFETATRSILEHLVSLGHKHIGLIGGREYIGPDYVPYVDKRERTFLQFMEEHPEILCTKEDIYIDSFTAETGYLSMQEALKKQKVPTAFFCESDTIAMGALRATGEEKCYGISVFGFNNIAASQYFNPPLSTVHLDVRMMCEVSISLLEIMFQYANAMPLKASLSTQLIIRESTKIPD